MPRPPSDPALSFILQATPDGMSREAYLRELGIISANAARRIREAECQLTEADLHEIHCPGCEEKYDLHRRSAD